VQADRELPVVWAVAKGSLVNKAILVPAALAISAFAPWAVTVLLMIGGAYLCFEGAEKLAHRWLHSREEDEAQHAALTQALGDAGTDLVAFEKDKIRGAVRTDFVLSAEIIAIALGIVATQPLATQAGVLAVVAVVMTLGVYGFVAAIVKMDDAGLALSRRDGRVLQRVGALLLSAAPRMMRYLTVLGTAAMFLVGGGILVHGVPPLHHAIAAAGAWPGIGWAAEMLANALIGVVAGALVLGAVTLVQRLSGKR
jgi:predicted DNA repair protein MutK